MNTFHGVGRLTADPTSRVTKNGTTVCSMRVAFSRPGKNDDADFLSVTSFGKGAESHLAYLTKGRLIEVSGRIEQQSWQADDVWHERIEIIADQVGFLDKPTVTPADDSEPVNAAA